MPKPKQSKPKLSKLQKIAKQARGFFTNTGPRKVWTFTDERPEWLFDLVYEVHGSMLPDDYKFLYVVEALDLLHEHEDPEYARDQIEADIYNKERLDWLSSHLERSGYVDEVRTEFGETSPANTMEDIGRGQWREKTEVFDLIRRGLENRLDEESEEVP